MGLPAWFLHGSCCARLNSSSVRGMGFEAIRRFAVPLPVLREWCAQLVVPKVELDEPDP